MAIVPSTDLGYTADVSQRRPGFVTLTLTFNNPLGRALDPAELADVTEAAREAADRALGEAGQPPVFRPDREAADRALGEAGRVPVFLPVAVLAAGLGVAGALAVLAGAAYGLALMGLAPVLIVLAVAATVAGDRRRDRAHRPRVAAALAHLRAESERGGPVAELADETTAAPAGQAVA
jgi:hypothetical protein